MTRNPFINGLAALLYVVLVVSALYYAPMFFGTEENIFVPIAVLSLFVFSAASMGYLVLYQPLRLLLEGEKDASIRLFGGTLGVFAASAVILLAAGLYLSSHW